ncbi:protein of unknown function [Limnospira indica PCC 8005]|uniref:Uncharacterized protein n=1 Tax=Limnospira indica PCC 8005 TaxID=376219 RepID=A0A9P1KGD0_9CYAN|nr:protein of unknown function [Limnospira indica PCC 8005]CDM95474.1 protein of unknown function [Limnospira indica PCC 8005]CDM95943.1 protein of unknown function [Limnospira indica PCC 8005]
MYSDFLYALTRVPLRILRLLALGVEVLLTGGLQMVNSLTLAGSLVTELPLKMWSKSIGIGTPIFEVASTGTSTTKLLPRCGPLAVAKFAIQSSLYLFHASAKGMISVSFFLNCLNQGR